MRRALYFVAVITLVVAGTGQAATSHADLSRVAAGRVRFIEGTGGEMTFQGKTVAPDLDFLVLVGAAFRTNQSRLELQTLNGDLFWFGHDTDFHFEASDPQGDQTTLFLGKGSFVVRTKAPFALITGAGSVLLPDRGTYSVSKGEFGKEKLVVGTVVGPSPTVIKQSTLFSKISIGKKVNEELVGWMHQREKNWKLTLGRAGMFSNVDKMSPMLAYTNDAGKLRWRRVATVRPISWAQGLVRDNLFLWGPPAFRFGYLRATGFLPTAFMGWSDFETSLWFMTNWYNSLRWAWDVPHGWHAEWYWDPLGGFGAEFSLAGYFWGPAFGCGGHYRYWTWPDEPGLWFPPIWAGYNVPRPVMRGRIAAGMSRPVVVRLASHARLRDRLRTDPGLRSIRQAERLNVRPADLRRARARRTTRPVYFPRWNRRGSDPVYTSSQSTSSSQTGRRVGRVVRPSPAGARSGRPANR